MKLSVCIPVKNRNYNLKGCIESLDACTGIDEIVIGDFHSTDTDYSWLEQINTPTKVVKIDGDFSIGKGKNVAAENSMGDILFFLDADCVVPQSLITKIHKIVPMGFVYSPIMFLEEQDRVHGEWAVHSFGQIAVTREQWQSHKWEEWTSYGGEDNIFFGPYKDDGAIRDQVFGFVHQYHTMDERTKNYVHEAGHHLEEYNLQHYGTRKVSE